MSLLHPSQLDIKKLKERMLFSNEHEEAFATQDMLKERSKKTINFVFGMTADGNIGPIIKFPYEGIITEISANCVYPANEDAVIDIEKISKEDFINKSDNWETILSEKLIIPSGEIINNSNYELQDYFVNKNDFFRINFIQSALLKELSIQITITI